MTELERAWFGWHITRSGMKPADIADAALVGFWRQAKEDARLRPNPPPRVRRTAHVVTPVVENRVVALEADIGRQATRVLGTIASTAAVIAATRIGGPIMGEMIRRWLGNRWTTVAGVAFGALATLQGTGVFPPEWAPIVNVLLTVAVTMGFISSKDASTGSGPPR